MSIFTKRISPCRDLRYPGDAYRPVIRSSICTGEKTACMQDLKTGHLTELMLIKSEADIDAFCEEYGVRREDIATVY